MTGWLMIFLLTTYNGGGPGVAQFATKEACMQAIEVLKQDKQFYGRFVGAVCVPQS